MYNSSPNQRNHIDRCLVSPPLEESDARPEEARDRQQPYK